MSSGDAPVDREILAAYTEWEAANDKIAALSDDALTHSQLADVMNRRERVSRRQRAVDHAIVARLAAEATPQDLGGTSLERLEAELAERERFVGGLLQELAGLE